MVRATGPLVWEWSALTDELHLTSRLQAIVGRADTRAAWRALVRDEDRARYAQVVEAALAAGARWTVRYHLRGCDGNVEVEECGYPVHGDRELVRVLGVLSFAGEPLGETTLGEHELRQFVEMIPQLAWSMDASGWIHFYNRRWYNYTGTRFEDMVGWGWLAVQDPYDLPRILRIWQRALENGEAWEDEVRLRRHDGQLRWHLSRAMPIRDARGQVTHWFGTNTDIHDQKLAAEEYARLLASERFRQADVSTTRRHGGLGLGLAIARELVQRHGGDIEAFSAGTGRGARFKVWFPIASTGQLETAAISLDPSGMQAVPLTGIRVLVVDDNAYAREMLAETLLGCGATVSVAAGVHEALRAFKLDLPDVIVSDIGMPELDGFSLAQRVRAMTGERERTVPMIALTAYASLGDRERAEAAGFDRYLAKPADAARLSHMIATLVATRTVSGLR